MKFPARAGGDFQIAPAGNHLAICNAVVDCGMQPGSAQYPAPRRQVYLRFELPTERTTFVRDGQEVDGPMSIGATYTASMSEKANLRRLIESWFGKKFADDDAASEFDLSKLIGRRCLLNVVHTAKNGKSFANIAGATPVPRGMPADHPQANAPLYFDTENPDQDAYDRLPEWLRKKIDARLDAATAGASASAAQSSAAAAFNDEIPF